MSNSKFSKLSCLICGFGSIGKRHYQNLVRLGVQDISVFDPHHANTTEFKFVDEAVLTNRIYDVGVICSPNFLHFESYKNIHKNCKSIFMEKPLGISEVDLNSFEGLPFDGVFMVGANYRFEPSLIKLKEFIRGGALGKPLFFRSEFGFYLPHWRKGADYKKNYSASRAMGGGVVLDRIHEIDYLQWIFGQLKTKNACVEKISSLEIDTEDYAVVHVSTSEGWKGSIHLDYLQPKYTCKLKVVGDLGMLEWSYQPTSLVFTDLNGKETVIIANTSTDVNEMYLNQMNYFLDSVMGSKQPQNALNEAIATTRKALEIRLQGIQ